MTMTKRQRMYRRNLIARCAEGSTEGAGESCPPEVIRDVRQNVAEHVGLWVARHRGLMRGDW